MSEQLRSSSASTISAIARRQRSLTVDQKDLLHVSATLLFVVAAVSLASRGTFLHAENLGNILAQNAVLFVLAIGQFLVVLTGGIDLSIGAVVALSSVLFVSSLDFGVTAAAVIAVAASTVVGLVNGLLVSFVRLPSFVTTLGSMQIVYSLAKIFTGGGTVRGGMAGTPIPPFVLHFYSSTLAGVPLPTVTFVVVFAAVLVYMRLAHGHLLYAVGDNAAAAYLAGVMVNRVRIIAYMVGSALAGVGGILFAALVSYGDPQAGTLLPLDAIAAVSIGGASLEGGRGTLVAVVFGVLIIAILNNGMNLLGVSPTLQPAIKGAIIVLTVLLYSRRSA